MAGAGKSLPAKYGSAEIFGAAEHLYLHLIIVCARVSFGLYALLKARSVIYICTRVNYAITYAITYRH